MLAGCTSTQVGLTSVGPNPAATADQASNGRLQVFSRIIGRSEGDNPAWHQHGSYYVCDLHGVLVKRVGNTVGRYEEAPQQVRLPPGKFLVKAQAKDYFSATVIIIFKSLL